MQNVLVQTGQLQCAMQAFCLDIITKMRLQFPFTELLESSGDNKTLGNPNGEASDAEDFYTEHDLQDCKNYYLTSITQSHTLEEILLCHVVVDYVGIIGYCASAEQGLSGVQEEYQLPPS